MARVELDRLCCCVKNLGSTFAFSKWKNAQGEAPNSLARATDYDSQWKSSVYFECHYFDVSLNPAIGQPFWTAKNHVDLDGETKKIDGRWLLMHVSSSAVSVPVP
jgi:hypothetical protein